MITAALLTSLALTAGPGEDIALPERAALQVEIGETHFMARSLVEAPLLLVFASEDGRLQTAFWLAAGGQYDEDFPRGTLAGLELEVVRPVAQGWLTSGAMDLDGKVLASASLTWVLESGRAVAFEGEGEPLSVVTPAGSHLPPQLNLITSDRPAAPAQAEASEAFHVPVVTPSKKPKGDKPPKLRKKPLPPV